MEAGGSEGEKKTPEGENKTKRKMKTASQVEVLEKTFAEGKYPSDSVRAELADRLGLTDRQLQMWFCHRRLKEKKGSSPSSGKGKQKSKQRDSPGPAAVEGRGSGEAMVVGNVGNEHASGLGLGHGPFEHTMESRRVVPRHAMAAPTIGDLPAKKRYYLEEKAIAVVEAGLGVPVREDGPILGMEFDPLPPDAFGAPIGTTMVGQQKQFGRPFDPKIYECSESKPSKGAARALYEYQFIPEQPTVRSETYERLASSYYHGSPTDGLNARTSISTGQSLLHGNEQLTSGYGFQGSYDSGPRKTSLTNTSSDACFGTNPMSQLENPLIASESRVTTEDDVVRTERKRKSEESRMAREIEAQEKKIRKELEKQDILRRKREEQIRKEMERHDRERRKEEERLLREKQREEERYQREQRRELERREKFLQKESIRAEKLRQKEELRREKEAARLKAANERAIARRIAKESMELVDDERLELMELAASSKGLSSILSLDLETLQNLDLFRDMQITFPPRSAQLKKPFSIQPWTDSEENIGNLLMAWRFLITFADVLGLWPFTLDEFTQAFHDYDPRLLGEIHISLLRSIIKDIENVARTPSMGLGASQTSAANPGGGHPLIIEGAYAWGFDIRSWHRHLNPLTWPEILRQLALSAGFGPQLKKRNIEPSYLHDDNEDNNGENIISNLRSGAAVERAFAKMQERGFANSRRSRHRLTPGTVKFAAFHVLSLEGSKGLTILEVADRIQKSGLRDLSTSRTPEASIAAALSRDSKLFERTAPSTYCVRAAYRKDPADAEAIVSAARERIRIFKSGFLDEDADDGERDEDSESDVAEDPDVDDLGNEINSKKEAQGSQEVNKLNTTTLLENRKDSVQVIETPERDDCIIGEGLSTVHFEGFVKMKDSDSSLGQPGDVKICNDVSSLDCEDPNIDESNSGEPWVQGLMEGEYSDLSVEERLSALVALIGIAMEGNSIRLVLEERLEAANALKKQMWADMQLDKRRLKEEFILKMHYPPFMGNKFEPNLAISSAEDRQSPFVTVNNRKNESVDVAVQEERVSDPPNNNNCVNSLPSEGNMQVPEVSADPDNHQFQQPGYAPDRSRSQLKSYIGHKAEEMYVYRSLPLGLDRRRNRYWQFNASASQNDPGCGRIFVELHDGHWRLIESEEGFDALLASLDVRGVRESHLQMMLQKIEISFKKAVRKKMLLDNMGRESEDTIKTEAVEITPRPECSISIDSPASTLCLADSDVSETSTSFVVELGRNGAEKNSALKRHQDLERWIWKESLSSSRLCALKYGKKRCNQLLDVCDYCRGIYSSEEGRCPCHGTYGTSGKGTSFSEHVAICEEKHRIEQVYVLHDSLSFPPRITVPKMLLALIEVSVPPEALQSSWTDSFRKSWCTKLACSLSAEDLLQVLTLLESAVKRDYLSSNFETTDELLNSSSQRGCAATNSFNLETVMILPWVPLTTAAMALRLMEFDAAIFYVEQQKVDSQKLEGSGDFIIPSNYAGVKNPLEDETLASPFQISYLKDDNWADLGSSGHGRGSRGRGGRVRTRGSRSQRRPTGSRAESKKRTNRRNKEALGQGLGWKGQQRGRGRKHGRRSVRSRQKPAKKVETGVAESILDNVSGPRSPVRKEWNADDAEDNTGLQFEGAEIGSSGRSDYDDENGQGSGDEYDDMVGDDYAPGFNGKSDDYPPGFNGKSDDLLEGSDYNVDLNDEEVDDEDEDEDEDEVGDGIGQDGCEGFDVGQFINEDSDEEDEPDGGEQNIEVDQDIGSSSSDYSE
ncbi:hypothetical protein UlMin_020697 [Ulmus minor]